MMSKVLLFWISLLSLLTDAHYASNSRVSHLRSNRYAKRLCELARIDVYLHSKIENQPIAWGLVALTEKDFLEQA